jgi:predicted transcriptional regulator
MAADIRERDWLVTLVTRIVTAYVSHNHVQAAELPVLLSDVHAGLLRLRSGTAEPAGERPRLTAAEIRRSIRPEGLVSFEDGKVYKTLRRHLTVRGLTPETYRAKWGLPQDYPMTAAAYSAARSQLALDRGLGRSRSLRSEAAEGRSVGIVPTDAQIATELPEQAEVPDAFDEGITREPFEEDGAAP